MRKLFCVVAFSSSEILYNPYLKSHRLQEKLGSNRWVYQKADDPYLVEEYSLIVVISEQRGDL